MCDGVWQWERGHEDWVAYADDAQQLISECAITPLKDHHQFKKYFRMLRVGVSEGAVKHKMAQNRLPPEVLDHDPDAPHAAVV